PDSPRQHAVDRLGPAPGCNARRQDRFHGRADAAVSALTARRIVISQARSARLFRSARPVSKCWPIMRSMFLSAGALMLALRGKGDGFFAGLAIDQKKSADHFLRFRERTIDDLRLPSSLLHPRRAGVRAQRFAGDQQPALFEALAEANHAVVNGTAFGLGAGE